MIIPYNISDFKRNLYHSQNRRDGVAGLRSPASRRDLCPPLPKNVCRAGIIPTGSCAAARRLFQQYPKTLGAPKTGRGGKDPAASRIVFSFPDFRLCCRAPSLSRTAARRLILPSLLSARLRQEAQLLCADAFLCRKNAVADCAVIHPPSFAHAAARMSEMRQTILIFGEKYYTFLSKREYPGFSEVPYCRLKFSSFFFM